MFDIFQECRRLISLVEHLTEQRKEVIEVMRTVNTTVNELILSLQTNNPPKPEINNGRLRIEQSKITDILEDQKQLRKSFNDHTRSSSLTITVDDNNNISSSRRKSFESSITNSTTNAIDTTKTIATHNNNTKSENETYTDLLKRQDRELNKLKQKFDTLLELYQLDTSSKSDSKTTKMRLSCALQAFIITRLNEQLEGYFSNSSSNITLTTTSSITSSKLPSSIISTTSIPSTTDSISSPTSTITSMDLNNNKLMKDYDDDNLELDIVDTTDKLLLLLKKFIQVRTNNEESIRNVPKEIKRIIYEMLSEYAFSKNPSKNNLSSLTQQLINFLDQYRTIHQPPEKIFKIENNAKRIIEEFISIMWFKLKSLDPIPQIRYYPKGSGVDVILGVN
ncbi:11474_t:CDS:2 [Diversispora eburnea]|uniref:11474_t:CDS:1 n=1 Tax=Diversispora eburnea TaxID=1213867 RepID=A0A9N9FCJ8_9GLOM|nr:11474_t:CDS:2 [Diversispora eburnea]